jgi:hypothetical protein
MYYPTGELLGCFIKKVSGEGNNFYFWESANAYLFAAKQFWGGITNEITNGRLCIKDESNSFETIAYWRKQKDGSLIVLSKYNEGLICIPKIDLYEIYWADSLDRLERLIIKNNPGSC